MIHAFLFLTYPAACRESGGHGLEFQSLMNQINSTTSLSITIYHTFHDEVLSFKKHIWKCSGPCSQKPPYFGLVRRAMNRPPGHYDPWWQRHLTECGGKFEKIGGPEGKENSGVNKGKKLKKNVAIPLSSSSLQFNNIDKNENASVNLSQIDEKNIVSQKNIVSKEASQSNLSLIMLFEESETNLVKRDLHTSSFENPLPKKKKVTIKNKIESNTIDQYFIEQEVRKSNRVKKMEGYEFLYDYGYGEKKMQPSKVFRYAIQMINDGNEFCQILINQNNKLLILYEIILLVFHTVYLGDLFLDIELTNAYNMESSLEEIKIFGICKLYFKVKEDVCLIEYKMEYLEKETMSEKLRNALGCPVVCDLDLCKGEKEKMNEKIKALVQ